MIEAVHRQLPKHTEIYRSRLWNPIHQPPQMTYFLSYKSPIQQPAAKDLNSLWLFRTGKIYSSSLGALPICRLVLDFGSSPRILNVFELHLDKWYKTKKGYAPLEATVLVLLDEKNWEVLLPLIGNWRISFIFDQNHLSFICWKRKE